MRDKVLAYALAISVGVHLMILCFVGKTSAARPIEVDALKLVRVDVVKTPDEVKPVPEVSKPAPPPPQLEKEHASVPPPERIPVAPPKRVQSTKYKVQRVKPPVTPQPVSVKPPGNPGGPLDLGSGSSHGQDLGGSGKTPVGWVPGPSEGTGTGSGKGEGVGKPEPVPGAVEGPGKEPAPPPAPDVDVRVCTESGMLPGPNCESTAVRSFRPGREPDSRCTVCRPKHVSRLADRSVPELISGRRAPKYPDSARDKGVEGSVTVEYTVNTEGNVVGVKVTSSSGSSELDRAAVAAVESRKYKPAIQAGIPRNYRKRETFTFALD